MPVSDSEENTYFKTETGGIKLVCDYTGLNFNEAVELDCFTFRTIFKDAFIDKLSQTEKRREYLENCWILTQTKPDREKLREKYNRSDKEC